MILFIDRFQHDDYKYQARLGYDWEHYVKKICFLNQSLNQITGIGPTYLFVTGLNGFSKKDATNLYAGCIDLPIENDFEIISELDRLVTNMVDLKFALLNVKHPLLYEIESLREFWNFRLLEHRSREIELIEFGNRLF
jgi:hypothetical protein